MRTYEIGRKNKLKNISNIRCTFGSFFHINDIWSFFLMSVYYTYSFDQYDLL